MRHFIKGLGYKYDDDNLLVKHGEEVFCDNEYCEARAQHLVAVSQEKAHDGHRRYCEACVDVYFVGLQHGRYHEAACHGMFEPTDNTPQKMPSGKA